MLNVLLRVHMEDSILDDSEISWRHLKLNVQNGASDLPPKPFHRNGNCSLSCPYQKMSLSQHSLTPLSAYAIGTTFKNRSRTCCFCPPLKQLPHGQNYS